MVAKPVGAWFEPSPAACSEVGLALVVKRRRKVGDDGLMEDSMGGGLGLLVGHAASARRRRRRWQRKPRAECLLVQGEHLLRLIFYVFWLQKLLLCPSDESQEPYRGHAGAAQRRRCKKRCVFRSWCRLVCVRRTGLCESGMSDMQCMPVVSPLQECLVLEERPSHLALLEELSVKVHQRHRTLERRIGGRGRTGAESERPRLRLAFQMGL